VAVAVDESTPAFAAGDADPWVTAEFDPPSGSLLVVAVPADDFNHDPTITPTSSGLTFTSRVRRDSTDTHEGLAEIFTAPVPTGGARTVSVSTTSENDSGGVKVWVVTGHDPDDPIDATGSGSSTANAITPTVLTTVTDGAWVFGCACEWQSRGVPTSSDEEEGYDDSDLSLIAVRKAAATSPAGAVTLNMDAPGGAAAQWNWVAVAIKPAGGGGVTLTPAATLHSHAADAVALTQKHALAPAAAVHGHAADAVALTQKHALAPAAAVHGHAADAVALTQKHSLEPAATLHGHTADEGAVTVPGTLAPASTIHAHTADAVALTQKHALAPAGATHAHAADQASVTTDAPAAAEPASDLWEWLFYMERERAF
jgi:hypothetical protein